MIWGFPKIRGTIFGVPITRTIVFWGLYRGPLILGNYHIGRDVGFFVASLLRRHVFHKLMNVPRKPFKHAHRYHTYLTGDRPSPRQASGPRDPSCWPAAIFGLVLEFRLQGVGLGSNEPVTSYSTRYPESLSHGSL